MEFTREQKKELLIREVELAHEIEALSDKLIAGAELLKTDEDFLRRIIKNDTFDNTEHTALGKIICKINFTDLENDCKILKEKCSELEDTERFLQYVQINKRGK